MAKLPGSEMTGYPEGHLNSGSPDFKSKFSKEKTADPNSRFSLVSHKVTRVLVTSLDLSPLLFALVSFNIIIHINLTIIGGLQPISRDTDNNAAMYNCWWTNKRS